MYSQIDMQIATIANGEQTSNAIHLGGGMLLRVTTGAGVDSTTMTIQTSPDNVTYTTLYKAGAALTIAITSSAAIELADEQIFANYIKLVAGSAETPAKTWVVESLRY